MNSNDEKEKTINSFLHNLYTKEDAELFFREMKERENQVLINDILSGLEKEYGLRKDIDVVRHQQYIQEAKELLIRLEKKKRIRFKKAAYIAAMVSVLFIAVYIFHHLKTMETSSVLNSETATNYGEKKQVFFSDCTRVVLNSRTKIVFPDIFSKNERRVRLSGEAYFDVNKDKSPFIVETGCFEIQVLGTVFNVKSYDEDELVSVAVNEGCVKVSMHETTLVLRQDEKVTLNTSTGKIIKENIQNNGNSFAWMDGWLCFDRTPIRDIAKELERIYGCRIIFKEGQEFSNLITGEHDNQSLESILQSIEFICGIKYLKKENEVILYK